MGQFGNRIRLAFPNIGKPPAPLSEDGNEFGVGGEQRVPVIGGMYGSRFLGGPHRVLFFWHMMGNRFLTLLSNMFTDLNLTDMETCYKVINADLLKRLPLSANRFGFEPEVTARLAQARARIYELPISYDGRSYAEGKKINWKDGVSALYYILRSNLFGPKIDPWQVPEVPPWEGRAPPRSDGAELAAGDGVANDASRGESSADDPATVADRD